MWEPSFHCPNQRRSRCLSHYTPWWGPVVCRSSVGLWVQQLGTRRAFPAWGSVSRHDLEKNQKKDGAEAGLGHAETLICHHTIRARLSPTIRTRLKTRTGSKQGCRRTLICHYRLRLPSKNVPLKSWFNPMQELWQLLRRHMSHPKYKGFATNIGILHSTQQQIGLHGNSSGVCLTWSGPDSNKGQGLSRLAAELLSAMINYGPKTYLGSLDSTPCKTYGGITCHIRKVASQLKSIQSAKRLLPTQDPAFNTTNRIPWDQCWSLSQTVMMRLKPRTGSKHGCRRTLIWHDQLQFKIAPLQFGFNHVQASWQHSTCHIRKVSSQHHDSNQSAKGLFLSQDPGFNTTSSPIAWDQRWTLSHTIRASFPTRDKA